MALDLYIGPLSRYHANNWENLAQKAAREEGQEYHVVRPTDEGVEPASSEEVCTAVKTWRDYIATFFDNQEGLKFTWEEQEEGEYFTDRPGWGGYFGLLLAASRPNGESLPKYLPHDIREDEAYMEAMDDWEESPFAHILKPELWLPIPDSLIFQADYLTRDSISIGTAQGLLFQLRALNDSRFGLDARGLDASSYTQPALDDPVEAQAEYGLATFMRAAEWAISHRLPMILDY